LIQLQARALMLAGVDKLADAVQVSSMQSCIKEKRLRAT
jgi:hypothetical protein